MAKNGLVHKWRVEREMAERFNQQMASTWLDQGTLKEMMNAILISSGLPQNMRGEVILSSNYLLNKVS